MGRVTDAIRVYVDKIKTVAGDLIPPHMAVESYIKHDFYSTKLYLVRIRDTRYGSLTYPSDSIYIATSKK